ncbi:MAG TPA: hypothetical protein VMU84_01560, partial [Thermoanaerobaculia bacterium]|nr:hypothetical protein [Thermoanaerobaculia bacterium]
MLEHASAVRRIALAFMAMLAATSAFATDYYADSAGGNWITNTTWHVGSPGGSNPTPGTYPGTVTGDNVFIQLSSGVSVNSGIPQPVVLAHSCACTLNVQTGGTLKVTGSSTVLAGATLAISGGTITNDNTLSFAAASFFNWTGGLLNGGGTTFLAFGTPNSAKMNLTSGTNIVSNQFLNVDGE